MTLGQCLACCILEHLVSQPADQRYRNHAGLFLRIASGEAPRLRHERRLQARSRAASRVRNAANRANRPARAHHPYACRSRQSQAARRPHPSLAATLFGKFAHRMAPAGGDIPGCDTALLPAMRIRAQHRLDDVVDIDEVEYLCARRDRHAFALCQAADERRQKPMRRLTGAIDLEETQQAKTGATAIGDRARHQTACGL